MRRLLPLATGAALVATTIAFAPPAAAKVTMGAPTVRLTAPYAKSPTEVVVVAKVTQTSYNDISLDIALEGFQAKQAFDYAKGACPTSVIVVDTPLTVLECGWQQEGTRATLRLALGGTLSSGTVKVRTKSRAVTAPVKAGMYPVSLSSWAFPTVKTQVSIASGPVK